jgi:putative NIF3 family GTP cyclohydrolase 1 type 2
VTWLATDAVLKEASELGCGLVVSHEGAFYPAFQGTPSEDRHLAEKHRLMDELGITLVRCHDTWDRMPDWGICDRWAEHLGYPTEPRPVDSFYRVCRIPGLTVKEVGKALLRKVQPLGQNAVALIGREDKKIERMVVGTGAISRLPDMYDSSAELILATDDGIHTTYGGLWSLDLDVPVLVVNHATAELPGMMALADYIRATFDGIEATYLPCGFPPHSIAE